MTEKDKIFYNVWCCAYQRRYMYRGTDREHREHTTLLMCLGIAKWYVFDSEKPNYLSQKR